MDPDVFFRVHRDQYATSSENRNNGSQPGRYLARIVEIDVFQTTQDPAINVTYIPLEALEDWTAEVSKSAVHALQHMR